MPETENNPVVDKARELQHKLWMCAKRSKTRRFHALYDRIYRSDVLREAWRRVRSNGGAAGVDRETLEAIEQQGADQFLADIEADLRAGQFCISGVYDPQEAQYSAESTSVLNAPLAVTEGDKATQGPRAGDHR